ncbi:hypothetical protein DRP05_09575 [Archaeoglobales archaeon]|nr:MAG: hypothetical protein DRP05_09575 [Archaeoglobales archaeon]
MPKKIKLRRVASSLVVTIPKTLLKPLNWSEGDTVEIVVTAPRTLQLSKA